jgi:bifunctional non-homologous end joining protein LigD
LTAPVRRDPAGLRLLTRNGHDWTGRFRLIAEAAGALRARSFLIDGEAVACDGDGLPVLDRLRYRRQHGRVFLYAFDLLELNGQDLRREPLEVRKGALASVMTKGGPGLRFNEHCDDLPADLVFRHACKLGFEGIVSKRLGPPYRSGRSRDWLKMKNPNVPAVKREAEEDWSKEDSAVNLGKPSRPPPIQHDRHRAETSGRSDPPSSGSKHGRDGSAPP